MSTYDCERCGTKGLDCACPTCTEFFANRPDAGGMTVDQRLAEWDSWMGPLCIPFGDLHQRLEELAGRPIWTHELAKPEYIRAEIATVSTVGMEGVLAKLPHDKPVIAVTTQGETNHEQ